MTKETAKITCVHCGSDKVIKYGSYRGVQRYLCHKCGRKFKAGGSPFHMKSPAPDIAGALAMYYTGSSITDIRNHIRQQTGYCPSKSVVFGWIQKYTETAAKHFSKVKPKVGDTWIADETVIKINRKKYWLFDCIDAKTRFLLASHLSPNRGTREARTLMEKAAERADKAPKVVMTDKLAAYLDGIELAFGADAEHKHGSPFDVQSNTNLIERFQGSLKDRTKVLRGLKRPETARKFIEGWLIHYNYFRPHISLKGKTPARRAGIILSVNDWLDVVRQPTDTAKIEISTEPRPVLRLHHPKPTQPKPPALRRGEVFAGRGMLSKRYFRGAKRRRLV
jgi:transposase-like protein/DNA-directed RNA polymerase subunit RPC12/RpoP